MTRKSSAGRPSTSRRTPRTGDVARSWASSEAVRGRMQRQKTRDTLPEMAVRRLLHRAGLRYRVDVPPLPGLRRRADIVFGPARVAVFIDGCFWHGCPEHGARTTRSNSDYWAAKVARNRARDNSTDDELAAAGWRVIRAWEHEDARSVAVRIAEVVAARRPARCRRLGGTD
ncbi:very short patch repair endonuclease [Nonomuraea insulae]|uniref:Very short patch repair endonuclease n=1 Tax=Nonomuraea insulae TaxID=1616787 RepID=A0ABW1DA56_9ACTN